MFPNDFTPKQSGLHRRYTQLKPIVPACAAALVLVFLLLLLVLFWLPPIG